MEKLAHIIARILINIFWGGYALMILWSWFIVPTFALPALTLGQAAGLNLVAAYLTHQLDLNNVDKPTPDKQKDNWIRLTYVIVRPLIALTIGWFIHATLM